MKPNVEVTIELLATALSGLDQVVNSGRSEQAPHETLSGRLAAEALAAVAVTLKYLLAKEGQAILPGFGTFSVAEGATVFSPEEDLSDYVALAEGDESRRIRGLATTTVLHLHAALSLLPHLQDHLDEPVTVSTSDAQRALQRVFGDAPHVSVRSALKACAHGIRSAVGSEYAAAQSEYVETRQIPVRAIGAVKPFSATYSIKERTKAEVDVNDYGRVTVTGPDKRAVSEALKIVEDLVAAWPELHKTYMATVRRITDFGAYVEVVPDIEALLHVSEIADHHVDDVRAEVKEGEQILVKVINVDRNGTVRVSRKALLGEGAQTRAENEP